MDDLADFIIDVISFMTNKCFRLFLFEQLPFYEQNLSLFQRVPLLNIAPTLVRERNNCFESTNSFFSATKN